MGQEKLSGVARSKAVQDIFDRIAPRYDLMNRLMTLGFDQSWRRFVIKTAQIPPQGTMLDIATGTGDIAFEAIAQVEGVNAIGADFVPRMMRLGQQRPGGTRVRWSAADALNLPFPAEAFHAVTHGYLLRNVIDIPRALAEQYRVLKPGGRMVCLDTTPPRQDMLRPFIMFYLSYVIPFVGSTLTGQRDAYTYLPASTVGFKTPEELATLMQRAGFVDVQYRTFMFNTMAAHWGTKPR